MCAPSSTASSSGGMAHAPARIPILVTTFPPTSPSKFLDDGDATRLARAMPPSPSRYDAWSSSSMQTGVPSATLRPDVRDGVWIGDGWWLRVPLGKLISPARPLLPQLLGLLDAWQPPTTTAGQRSAVDQPRAALEPPRRDPHAQPAPAEPGSDTSIPTSFAIPPPTVNRGMRLEAIAALLGHRTLRMTIRYARIANRTRRRVPRRVRQSRSPLRRATAGADAEGPTMRRVRADHHRMLPGWCPARRARLQLQTICESCGFFGTTIEFSPTLKRQAEHAAAHHQPARAELFTRLAITADQAGS